MRTVDLGDAIRITGTFSIRSSGVATDPTTIVFKVRNPAAVVTTYTYDAEELDGVLRSGEGIYYLDYTPATAGLYVVRIYGTGTVIESQETWFSVKSNTIT